MNAINRTHDRFDPKMEDEALKATRVLYFTGQYPRISDLFIQREVVALRELGLCVRTAAVRRPGKDAATAPLDREATHYLLPANPLRILSAHIRSFFSNPRGYLRAAALVPRLMTGGLRDCFLQIAYFVEAGLLAEHMRGLRVTHLHNHFANSSCSVAMLAARMSGTPFSFTLHGPAIFFEAAKWRLDLKLRAAAWVNCISHFCASQAAVFAPDAAHKFRILRCAVDPLQYANDRSVESGALQSGRRFLFVGRMATVKGLPVLFEALQPVVKAFPDFELRLVGDGPQRAEFEAAVRARGLKRNIRFLGALNASEVRAELATADAFVLPSYAEGVPVVLMEAMAAGVPVIATRIAGIPELIADGRSGLLVSPASAPALTTAIENLLAMPTSARAGIIRNARETVEREFNLRHEAAKLKQWFLQSARSTQLKAPELEQSPRETARV